MTRAGGSQLQVCMQAHLVAVARALIVENPMPVMELTLRMCRLPCNTTAATASSDTLVQPCNDNTCIHAHALCVSSVLCITVKRHAALSSDSLTARHSTKHSRLPKTESQDVTIVACNFFRLTTAGQQALHASLLMAPYYMSFSHATTPTCSSLQLSASATIPSSVIFTHWSALRVSN